MYRSGTAKFTPQNINPYLCTHLIYAFGGLGKDDTIQPFDKYQDLEKGDLYYKKKQQITPHISYLYFCFNSLTKIKFPFRWIWKVCCLKNIQPGSKDITGNWWME